MSADILEVLSSIGDNLSASLVSLSAISLITMGVVEAFKTRFGGRARFLRKELEAWLGGCEGDLCSLLYNGNSEAMYSQPFDKLGSETKAALPIMLEYPAAYRDLLLELAGGPLLDHKQVLADIEALSGGNIGREGVHEIQARLVERCRATVNGRFLVLQQQWKQKMQLWVFVTTVVLSFVPVSYVLDSTIVGAVFAVGTGLLAPVARDVVVAMEKLRT